MSNYNNNKLILCINSTFIFIIGSVFWTVKFDCIRFKEPNDV